MAFVRVCIGVSGIIKGGQLRLRSSGGGELGESRPNISFGSTCATVFEMKIFEFPSPVPFQVLTFELFAC